MYTPVYVYLSSEPFSKIKLKPTSHFGVYRTDPIKLVVNETTVATYQYVRLDRVFNKIFIMQADFKPAIAFSQKV